MRLRALGFAAATTSTVFLPHCKQRSRFVSASSVVDEEAGKEGSVASGSAARREVPIASLEQVGHRVGRLRDRVQHRNGALDARSPGNLVSQKA
jgi:hypothetical protein